VKLGRSLLCKSAKPSLTLDKCKTFDCTSVKAPGGFAVTRDEYAVFEPWQVESIKVDSVRKFGSSGTSSTATTVPHASWPSWVFDLDKAVQHYTPPATPPSHVKPATTSQQAYTGRTKANGTPDMRTTEGKAWAAVPGATGGFGSSNAPTSFSGFTGSASHSWNGNSGGPVTAAGLPDMRYSCNRQ
jgi:hypothetical protein